MNAIFRASFIFFMVCCLSVGTRRPPNYSKTFSELSMSKLVRTSSSLTLVTQSQQIPLIPVPDAYQYNEHSSGSSALAAILSFYNFPNTQNPYRQTQIAAIANLQQNTFVTLQQLETTARQVINQQTNQTLRNMFQMQIVQHLSINQLQNYIQNGVPVIIPIQRGQMSPNYVIVIGFDEHNFYIQDTKRLGSIGFVPRTQLLHFWRIESREPQVIQKQKAFIIKLKNGISHNIVPLLRNQP